jgi:hypothetical protein
MRLASHTPRSFVQPVDIEQEELRKAVQRKARKLSHAKGYTKVDCFTSFYVKLLSELFIRMNFMEINGLEVISFKVCGKALPLVSRAASR